MLISIVSLPRAIARTGELRLQACRIRRAWNKDLPVCFDDSRRTKCLAPDFSWPRLARLRATVVFASLECRLWQDDDRFGNARLRRVSRARRDRRPVRDSSLASLNHSEQLSRLGRPPERYRKRLVIVV